MARYEFADATDGRFDEFETRRRIAALEYDRDEHWEKRPRRSKRSRSWWRRSDDEWR